MNALIVALPSNVTVTGDPKLTLTIPLPKGLNLICNCKSEVEAIDWMDLVNQSIVTARTLKKRPSSSGKNKRRDVIVNKDGEEDGETLRKWDKSKQTVDVLSSALKEVRGLRPTRRRCA